MKKTISHLINQIQETANGKLNGGFGSIRGGAALPVKTNSTTCSGTNENANGGCSNTGNCTESTNKGTGGCSNTGTC